MSKNTRNPADHILPLNINGLQGRMLHMPAPRPSVKREILFIYGHHASLERWLGMIEVLNRYGSVTVPDLPGFGGMDSYYKVGQKPTIDALADYLAAFIKWRYKRKKVTIIALSFGFVVTTRMLQKYPELVGKVDILVSMVGFMHRNDFTLSKPRYWAYRLTAEVFSRKPMAAVFRHAALNSVVLRMAYARTYNGKKKFATAANRDEYKRMMDMEIKLWQSNDVRTYMYTSTQFLKLDNTKKQVDLPVWHVTAEVDHYFDNNVIEQHMRVVFKDFYLVETKLQTHAPSVIADAKMFEPLIPPKLRKVLAQS